MSETAPGTRPPIGRVAAVIGAAFAVKLVVLAQLRDHPLLAPHGELDTAATIDLARRIAAEGWLAPVDTSFVSPLYVHFLAVVFAGGGSVVTAQVVQIALGAAGVGLLYATARHWFGGHAAMAAAALAILTGPFSFNEVLILQSALDPFLVSCALYAATRAAASGGMPAFAAAGVSLGLLALNRPNALAYGAVAVAGLLLHHRRGALVVTMAMLAVLGGSAARTFVATGEMILIASHGGLNFYIGNHDRADGTYTPVPGITPSIAGQARDAARVAEASEGRPLTPGEVSAFFTRRAFDWMTDHPADAARLTLRKAAILLNRADVPLNYSYAYYASEPGAVLRVLVVGPWLILPAGLAGLLWTPLRRARRGYWVWAAFVPAYGASVVVFFVADRYRLPLLVPLCASAGAALVRAVALVRARTIRPLAVPAAVAAALTLVAFTDLGLDNGVAGEQTRRAVWLVERGEYDQAARYAEAVAAAQPHPGVMWFRLGQALLDARRHAEAADALARALAIDGPRGAIRLALGEALAGAGRAGDAVAHLEAAFAAGVEPDVSGPLLVRALVAAGRPAEAAARLAHAPLSAAGPGADQALDFGTLALEHGAPADAARWLRVAVERAPKSAEAHEGLGLALFLQGDPAAALPPLERACLLDPARASAHLNLAVVYAELGRFADARERAREALRLDPAEARAAALLKAIPR